MLSKKGTGNHAAIDMEIQVIQKLAFSIPELALSALLMFTFAS
jgi:hypothetical protein